MFRSLFRFTRLAILREKVMTSYTIDIPRSSTTSLRLEIRLGEVVVFLGANGSGKSRLAAMIEEENTPNSLRISAHRALNFPDQISTSRGDFAKKTLYENTLEKAFYRLSNQSHSAAAGAFGLLDDFSHLLEALYAEYASAAFAFKASAREGRTPVDKVTSIERLTSVWESLLPDRKLIIEGNQVSVMPRDGGKYSATQMSDGERAIFYALAHVILAPPGFLIIFDEPELHIHPAISSRLWDILQTMRDDCAMVVLTHDLRFAAERMGRKFVVQRYTPPGKWEIEPVPADCGFDEQTTTLIMGSRKPVLFVEGSESSLDCAIYRAHYRDFTVIPVGAGTNVIHAVSSLRSNRALLEKKCAGLIDRDDLDVDDRDEVQRLGVQVLPVCEVENLLLLPIVARGIAKDERLTDAETEQRLERLKKGLLEFVQRSGHVDLFITQHCRRRIDRALKHMNFELAKDVPSLVRAYTMKTQALDINAYAAQIRQKLDMAIANDSQIDLLEIYSNKGMLSLPARTLRNTDVSAFKEWVCRLLTSEASSHTATALASVLPQIRAE